MNGDTSGAKPMISPKNANDMSIDESTTKPADLIDSLVGQDGETGVVETMEKLMLDPKVVLNMDIWAMVSEWVRKLQRVLSWELRGASTPFSNWLRALRVLSQISAL
jgi:hypothetical protein